MTMDPAPDEPAIDELAAHLASMPDDTVFSYRTAAQIWGLWIPSFAGIEVTTPATARGSRYTTSVQRLSVIAHRRLLPPGAVSEHKGLPVTSREQTWVDLASALDVYDLIAAGDRALQVGADHEQLIERVAALRRTRGAVRARQAVHHLNRRSRSRPESRIRGGIVLAGLPEPRVNEAIFDRFGQWLAEPDLHYLEARLALEYNGADHAKLPRMRKDSVRMLDVQRADWEVRTYTAPHAYGRLHEVVTDVYDLLRTRAPELLTGAQLARRVTYLGDQRRRNRRL